METKVVTKYLRIAPRKVRVVLNAIKGRHAFDAVNHLQAMKKKAARFIKKTMQSAIASAKEKKMDEGRLIIKELRADGGPSYKRIMTRSMGRADRTVKRTTHLTIVLAEAAIISDNFNRRTSESEKVSHKSPLAGGNKAREKSTKKAQASA